MRDQSRYNTKALLALMGASSFAAMAATTVLANPLDPTVVTGNVSVAGLGTADVTIGNNSMRSIVDWKTFSIGSGETTTINQVSTDAAILNRVVSNNPSEIYGHLTSNGQVYLVNQSGILVGASGVVDTNGFVASTLDVSNTSFLGAGEMIFKQGVNVGGGITVEGTIRSVSGGDIFLLSREITIGEKGSINTKGYVGLGAGEEILLKPTDTGDGRISIRAGQGRIINRGHINAAVAELRAAGGNEYALAINNTGVIRATGYSKSGGRVMLTGGGTVRNTGQIHATKTVVIRSAVRVENAGTIKVASNVTHKGGTIVLDAPEISIEKGSFLDVSAALGGGRMLIGGGTQGGTAKDASREVVVMSHAKSVTVDAGAIFDASATESGNAGDITIWADGSTNFAGTIIAKAAAGKGGNAEVSGAHLTHNGSADLTGSAGFGTLLLDPGQVNINHELAGTNTPSTTDTFFDDTLATALVTANVTIATSAASGVPFPTQDIIIATGVVVKWNAATTLALLAGHDITALSGVTIQNTQTGDGVFTFVQPGVGGVVLLAGNDIKVGFVAATGGSVIGSEFGQNIFVAGVKASSLSLGLGQLPFILAPATTAANVTNPGSVTVTGSTTTSGAFAQLGYQQTKQRGNNTGQDKVNIAGDHAANGDITVIAGKDVTVTSGGLATTAFANSYAQIGHGGLNPNAGALALANQTNAAAEIVGNISVVAGEFVKGNVTVNNVAGSNVSDYAQIGHGSLLLNGTDSAGKTNAVQQGDISGNIGVKALNEGNINVGTAFASSKTGFPEGFVAQIGHGGHLGYFGSGLTGVEASEGRIQGSITVASLKADGVTSSTTGIVQLGTAVSANVGDDLYTIDNKIGHGAHTYLLYNGKSVTGDSSLDATVGAIQSFNPLGALSSGLATNITVDAGQIILIANEATQNSAPLSGLSVDNVVHSQIGSGGQTVSVAALATPTPIPSVSNQMNVSVKEGNITGDIAITAHGPAADGVLLDSEITAGLTAITNDLMVTRIGHGSQAYLNTAAGGAGARGGLIGLNGGQIRYEQANILASAIKVQTMDAASSITVKTNVAAGLSPVISSSTVSAIGSGGEALFLTGAGGVGLKNGASGFGGDILFSKGTVYDYAESGTVTDIETGADTSIQVISGKDINVLSSQTAALAAVNANDTISHIGHGSFIQLTTGAGGSSGAGTGSTGGRGGDIVMVQQTPDRDVEGLPAVAEDHAWGLRGLISLQANDPGKTAIIVKSSVTAALATAENASSSSQIGHGDYISATSGAGGAGGALQATDGTIPTWGGRGGNVDIDLSNMLIESNIVSSDSSGLADNKGITGAVLVDAQTTNALSPSQHNWSDAAIGHGEAVSVLTGKGGLGGSDTVSAVT